MFAQTVCDALSSHGIAKNIVKTSQDLGEKEEGEKLEGLDDKDVDD
jgi:hypothetical protein